MRRESPEVGHAGGQGRHEAPCETRCLQPCRAPLRRTFLERGLRAALPGEGGPDLAVDKHQAAGLGDGVRRGRAAFGVRYGRTVFGLGHRFEAAIVDQVGHHGLRGVGGKGFAIGQPVSQVSRQMPPEKRSARILGRPHAPLAKPATEFPNVFFDLLDKFLGEKGVRYLFSAALPPDTFFPLCIMILEDLRAPLSYPSNRNEALR